MNQYNANTQFPDFFRKHLQQLGFSLPETRVVAMAKKQALSQNNTLDTFYLDLKLANPPMITWTHNIQQVLGCKRLTWLNFINRIHPDYLGVYIQYALATYRLISQNMERLMKVTAHNSVLVPLRDERGQYYWFTQKGEVSEWDANYQLTAHINTYTRIAPYEDTLLLAKPMVLFGDLRNTQLECELGQNAGQAMVELLFNQHLENHLPMRHTHRCILMSWWACYSEIGTKTTHRTVAEQLSIDNQKQGKKPVSEATVKKYAQTILEAANIVFSFYPIRDMNELAGLLVRLFGGWEKHKG